jgi:hypothetical protein
LYDIGNVRGRRQYHGDWLSAQEILSATYCLEAQANTPSAQLFHDQQGTEGHALHRTSLLDFIDLTTDKDTADSATLEE